MQFIDEAVIHVKAGDGGNGSAAFRREDGVPRGGPSGGDGGNGGSIIVVADPQLSSLLDFKYRRHYKARPRRGRPQQGPVRRGRRGPDAPRAGRHGDLRRGTSELLVDLDTAGARVRRRAGRHRRPAATSTSRRRGTRRRTTAEPGTPGEERTVRLELKLLADVGLLGYPQRRQVDVHLRACRARGPKVADYPFTTLVPNLGVVRLTDERTFVIADIPGLIEGAAEGAGLGHQFLRHVERCRVLLHIVEATFTTGPDRTPIARLPT